MAYKIARRLMIFTLTMAMFALLFSQLVLSGDSKRPRLQAGLSAHCASSILSSCLASR